MKGYESPLSRFFFYKQLILFSWTRLKIVFKYAKFLILLRSWDIELESLDILKSCVSSNDHN